MECRHPISENDDDCVLCNAERSDMAYDEYRDAEISALKENEYGN